MTTPLRRQYLAIKQRYPHAIVFFRLGDFYETFDEDAETVARELEITLTSRPVGKDQRVPLAGVPYHALESYLARLIAKGYKVAICEQMEEPGRGKKLVDRQVVRVVTPGTVVEDNLLDRGANNYLAAVVLGEGICGLAYADVSTGEFACAQLETEALAPELERIAPSEVIHPAGASLPAAVAAALTPLPPDTFDERLAAERLLGHFGAANLEALGLAGQPLAMAAAGAVISYLAENQRAALKQISRVTVYYPGGFMALDQATVRNLELLQPLRANAKGSTLLSVLDHTKTAMGARLLRRWITRPLLDIREIERRQDGVQLFFGSAIRRARAAKVLARIPDLERCLARITAAGASPSLGTARELLALRRGLEAVPELRAVVQQEAAAGEGLRAVQEDLASALQPCAEAAALIASAIADEPQEGAVIRRGFSPELDSLRSVAKDARQYLAELEARERERTGIKSLKVGYNRVFGYYIEVSKANQRLVPEDYQRKQTLVGGERYTTPELRDLEYKVLHAQEQQEELERSLLRQVCAQVSAWGPQILATASAIALADVYCALAEAAAEYGYGRPTVDSSDEIMIRDGRHPVVERMLPDGAFVPNDAHLSSSGAQVIVLTGPNMAGKSTYLRQVALIVLMAQMGSFVPAAEARIGVVDRIFSRVGALDDISAGQSTFMVEMVETAAILHGATPRSLLIFDEVGRGTSTYDGMAIARAVVEFVHNRPDAAARTLFATHYHELTELALFLPRVRNYTVAVAEEEGRVAFLHRILPGGADRSYGVHVAQLAGLPRQVVVRAQEILAELESRQRGPARAPRRAVAAQLPLFVPDGGLAEEIAALDVDSMTPLQAITKLYELVEKARKKTALT